MRILVLFLFVIHPWSTLTAAAYAQLSSLTNQIPQSGGKTLIRLEKMDAIKGMELSENRDKVVIKEPGLYFCLGALQIGSSSKAETGYVDAWFVKNGKDIPNSSNRMTVEPSNTTGVLTCQIVIELKENDQISYAIASSGPSLGCIFIKPENEPSIPSVIFTMLKIDQSS